MGCCLSSQSNQGQSVTGGKPFRRNNIQWTSETPISQARLRQQRCTFWETAPFYEGRPEIWQAIQAAITSDDIVLAQSILDAANIKLPTGNPADGCYDELGTRYEIPLYCLVDPTNMVPEDEDNIHDGGDLGLVTSIMTQQSSVPCLSPSSPPPQSGTALTTDVGRGHQKTVSSVSSIIESPTPSAFNNLHNHSNNNNNIINSEQLVSDVRLTPGDHPIIVRLSTGKDISLKISTSHETVPLLKSRIYADPNAHLIPDTHHLKLIYLGKILDDHTSIIGDFTLTTTPPLEQNTVKLRAGAVIQALVISK